MVGWWRWMVAIMMVSSCLFLVSFCALVCWCLLTRDWWFVIDSSGLMACRTKSVKWRGRWGKGGACRPVGLSYDAKFGIWSLEAIRSKIELDEFYHHAHLECYCYSSRGRSCVLHISLHVFLGCMGRMCVWDVCKECKGRMYVIYVWFICMCK